MTPNGYHVVFWTEDIEGTEVIVSNVYEHYTLQHGDGIWKGQREKSLMVHVLEEGENFSPDMVRRAQQLCDTIKAVNGQQTVLVEVTPTVLRFI